MKKNNKSAKQAYLEGAYDFQAQQSFGGGTHLQVGNADKIKVEKVTQHTNINLSQPLLTPNIRIAGKGGSQTQRNSPGIHPEIRKAGLDSLTYFEELTIEGEVRVAKHETVISRDLSMDEILKYEAGSADIDYRNDKRRQHKNIPERRLLTAAKGHITKEGRMDVRRSILKDGGGNPPQPRASSTLFFNTESIVQRCINDQHVVEIKYNLLRLTEEQRDNLQAVLRGRDGLEAFEVIPSSIRGGRNCITQLAFESAYIAKNLIIALKQFLASYQKLSLSPKDSFSDTPWLQAITHREEAGKCVVIIDYPSLRLTQAERVRLQALLQKTKVDDFDCEPGKTVTLKGRIQQLVFVSEGSAQACIAELHAAMENGLRKDEMFQASGRRKQATTGASLVTVQKAKIVPSSEVSQEPLQHGGLPNLTHQGSAQIGYLQAHSVTVIGEHYTYYKPNKEDEERGNRILSNPELFYAPKPWGMLPKINPHFVGREEKLNELKTSFNQANQSAAVVINQRRLHRQAANREESQASANKTAQGVLGLGGVGKTQLAAEYVYTLLDAEEDKPANTTPLERRYALILWLRGQRILLEQDLRELAAWVGLLFEPNTPMKQITQALYTQLAN